MIGDKVKVIHSNKACYEEVIGKIGKVVKSSNSKLAVKIDGHYNQSSGKGLYWFDPTELVAVNEYDDIDNGGIKMLNYSYVAIVNLLDDVYKKDYSFALYDTEFNELSKSRDALVVVNPRGSSNRKLGRVKNIINASEYDGVSITAEVVAVADMSAHLFRCEEEKRLSLIKKKSDEIECEINKEINKRKSIEYYEKMAEEYKDNPRIAELVSQLKLLKGLPYDNNNNVKGDVDD